MTEFNFDKSYASGRNPVNVVFRYRRDNFTELQSLAGYYSILEVCDSEDDVEVLFVGSALNCLRYMRAERMKYEGQILVMYKIDDQLRADFFDDFGGMDDMYEVSDIKAAGNAQDLISVLHGQEVTTKDIGRLVKTTTSV